MGTIDRFEDLEIWQLARELLNLIYYDFRSVKIIILETRLYQQAFPLRIILQKGFHAKAIKNLNIF
jgi:hypothetical protein